LLVSYSLWDMQQYIASLVLTLNCKDPGVRKGIVLLKD
jgi:hypothetical protein